MFARSLPVSERRSEARMRSGEGGIWQRRVWEHGSGAGGDFAAHFDYVHFDPVEHGYVRRVADLAAFDVQGLGSEVLPGSLVWTG